MVENAPDADLPRETIGARREGRPPAAAAMNDATRGGAPPFRFSQGGVAGIPAPWTPYAPIT
jgi:hypothetical protein